MLTIAKKFDFCACHRLEILGWTAAENFAAFGRESTGTLGHGHQYSGLISVSGDIDSETGMICELSRLKKRLRPTVERLDHYDLNACNALMSKPTTPCQLSHFIYEHAARIVTGEPFFVTSVEVSQDDDELGIVGAEDAFRRMAHRGFFADILELDGDWRNWITYRDQFVRAIGEVPIRTFDGVQQVWDRCREIPLKKLGGPIAAPEGYCWMTKSAIWMDLPISFRATHCLAKSGWTPEENHQLFGKCSRLHGHRFWGFLRVLVADFGQLPQIIQVRNRLIEWLDYRDLNTEISFLAGKLPTCEHLIDGLGRWLKTELGDQFIHIELWETRSNRFQFFSSIQ